MALDAALVQKEAKPQCGIGVIDLRSGDLVHSLRIAGAVSELYDVVSIPAVQRPMAIGIRSDEIRRVISMGEA